MIPSGDGRLEIRFVIPGASGSASSLFPRNFWTFFSLEVEVLWIMMWEFACGQRGGAQGGAYPWKK